MAVNQVNDSEIGRKYAKEIARAQPNKYIAKHRPHAGRQPPINVPLPGTVAEEREARHRKTVEERQDQIYDTAFGLIKIAAKKGDIRGAASCLAQATAITGQMKINSPDNPNEIESDGYIEAVRATAKNDWKDARAISLEATEP